MIPYLVQRCHVRESFKKEDLKGVSFGKAIVTDYMGSAEFEFGALPKSLRRIANEDCVFIKERFSFWRGYPVDVWFYVAREKVNTPQWEEYIKRWSNILAGKAGYRLKEYSHLSSIGREEMPGNAEELYEKTQQLLDWDIENDVFIFTNKKFKKLIEMTLPESKKIFDERDAQEQSTQHPQS